MLQCYTLMLRCYSYGVPIHPCSQWRYITALCYISVPAYQLLQIKCCVPTSQHLRSILFIVIDSLPKILTLVALISCTVKTLSIVNIFYTKNPEYLIKFARL